MSTTFVKRQDAKPGWLLVDADGLVLGRLADHFGVQNTVAGGAVVCVLFAALMLRVLPAQVPPVPELEPAD